jgi:Spy/CpxP family protein refolding chaperone
MFQVNKQTIMAALLFVVNGYAAAQTAPPPQDAPPLSPAEQQKRFDEMREKMAKRQAELHDQLKITPAQEAAWKAFVQSSEPRLPSGKDASDLEKMNAVERMEKNLDNLRDHQARAQARLTALKNLYNTLSQEQQKRFDDHHKQVRKEMQDRMAKQMMRHDANPPAHQR